MCVCVTCVCDGFVVILWLVCACVYFFLDVCFWVRVGVVVRVFLICFYAVFVLCMCVLFGCVPV